MKVGTRKNRGRPGWPRRAVTRAVCGKEDVLMGSDILGQKRPSPPRKYPSHLLIELQLTWLPSLAHDLFEALLFICFRTAGK